MRVGLTTTVPVEIIFASRHVPVDVNNLFVTAENPDHCIEQAEKTGYPRTSCSWIKGLYGAILAHQIEKVIGVMVGDCSYTHSLMETLKTHGVQALPFAYPYDRDQKALKHEMDKLIRALGTNWDEVYTVKQELDKVRKKVTELDRLSWQEGTVTGFENHLWQVSCSDFNGDYKEFEGHIDLLLAEIKTRKPFPQKLRLGYIGVPPIITDLYQYLEEKGAYIVFNEVQRQFAMPYFVEDLVEQYTQYTYPYDVHFRLQDIQKEIELRELDGIIHYTQSFCHRQIDDIVFKKFINVPILTLEADRPGAVDARTKIRIDSFISMLSKKQSLNISENAIKETNSISKETNSISKETNSISKDNMDISNVTNNHLNKPMSEINSIEGNDPRRTCGIDLGSRSVKLAIVSNGKIEDLRSFNTIDFYRDYGRKVGEEFQVDFSKLNIEGVDQVVSTGYGRNTIKLAGAIQLPELEAHLLGALYQTEINDFTLLDLGGQDSKVIQVRNREMVDFITNDKCAASSGRFIENMTSVLGLELEEMARYYHAPVELNATCAVFGESELIGKISEGVTQEELAAGINYTIVKRVEPLLLKLYSDTIVFTGGVAKNSGVLKLLEQRLDSRIIVPTYPEYNGAIGAAIKKPC